MIVKLIEDATVKGSKFKKGTTVAVTRAEAMVLCRDGVAVSNQDVPCHDKEKEERFDKPVKKKRKKKTPVVTDGDLNIDNQL